MSNIVAAFGAFNSDAGSYGPTGKIAVVPAPVAGVPLFVIQILPTPTPQAAADVIFSTSQTGS